MPDTLPIPREPRFRPDQLPVTVMAELLAGARCEAVDISSTGVLVYMEGSPPSKGDTGSMSLETGGKRWSVGVRVVRVERDSSGSGHYVGLHFQINAHRIYVRVEGLDGTDGALATPNVPTRKSSTRLWPPVVPAPSPRPPGPPAEKPAVLLPQDEVRRVQMFEAYIKLIASSLALAVLVLPLLLPFLRTMFATGSTQFTAASVRLPIWSFEAVLVPCLAFRVARQLHKGAMRIPTAIGLFVMMALALILVHLAVELAVRTALP